MSLLAGRRRSTTESAAEPAPPTRQDILKQFQADFPGFVEAVLADARIFCAGRGERFEFRGRRDGLTQALRLAWQSDAFFALACYRGKARLQVLGVPVLPLVLHRLAMAIGQVCIGDPVVLGPGIYLPHGQVVIDGIVRIGTNVEIRPWVTIGLKEGVVHGATIGNGARIGTGAKIIGPVEIGKGAVIGANAVVVHDVPAHTTVVGVPARPLQR